MGIGSLLIGIQNSDDYLGKYRLDFYKQKFTSKLLKLSTQAMHIDMGTCAKIFGMSVSEFKVKMRVIGWIYRSDWFVFFTVLLTPLPQAGL